MNNNDKQITYISIEDIIPNRSQPRKVFDENEINNLAISIKQYGVIEPLIVRKIDDKYELIAGERRYKASIKAGLNKIPCIIHDSNDLESTELALLENIQRRNLTPIEEAEAYNKLISMGMTQEELANKLGISQPNIANKIRLLVLPQEVKNALLNNKISERHARSLLTLNDKELQLTLLNKIINYKMTVKQTEDEIQFLHKKEEISSSSPSINLSNFLNPNSIPNIENEIVEKEVEELETLDLVVPEIIEIKEDKNIFQNSEKKDEQNKFDFFNNIKEPLTIEKINTDETYNRIERIDTNTKKIIQEENKYIDEYGEFDLIKLISDVRGYINNLGSVSNNIDVTELDLDNKYQIIIDIKKEN